MTLIDERGRLFGKVNLIDATVAGMVLLVVPLSYAAYQLFRTPLPEIRRIDPARVVQAPRQRIRVEGDNLRPYLVVNIGNHPVDSFLVESPTSGEIVFSNIAPGTYDLVFYDAVQEVARRPGALTIVAMNADLGHSVEDVTVRFVVLPEVLPLVKAGDQDLLPETHEPRPGQPLPSPGGSPARLTSVRAAGELSAATSISVGAGTAMASYDVPQRMIQLDAVLRVPVVEKPDGLNYNGQSIKVGAPLAFETKGYAIRGSITDIQRAPSVPGAER